MEHGILLIISSGKNFQQINIKLKKKTHCTRLYSELLDTLTQHNNAYLYGNTKPVVFKIVPRVKYVPKIKYHKLFINKYVLRKQ